MRRRITTKPTAGLLLAVAATLALLATAAPAVAGPVASTGGWGKAIEVPGLSGVNHPKFGFTGAEVSSLSCASPGNCTAGGSYTVSSNQSRAFVVSEIRGRWRKAVTVPGPAGASASLSAAINAVSCTSAGNCGAGGFYTDKSGHQQAFTITQSGGRWARPLEVPGTAGLNSGGDGALTHIACSSRGTCTAAGSYAKASARSYLLAFVASEVAGHWRPAIAVPGLAALNYRQGVISALSCASAGNCGAGGSYVDGAGHGQAFLVTEVRGTWRAAFEVPGTAALNAGGSAGINAISCPAAGGCGAGGGYAPAKGGSQAFVVTQAGGTWGSAIEVPGTARLNVHDGAQVNAISCASPGNCGAGGIYADKRQSGALTNGQAFVASEVRGTWHTATEVPGIASLNKGDDAYLTSIACPTAGNCTAGGSYSSYAHGGQPLDDQAFVVSQSAGRWAKAIEVPGTGSLNAQKVAATTAVSCPKPGRCGAGGYYADRKYQFQAFVDTQG